MNDKIVPCDISFPIKSILTNKLSYLLLKKGKKRFEINFRFTSINI